MREDRTRTRVVRDVKKIGCKFNNECESTTEIEFSIAEEEKIWYAWDRLIRKTEFTFVVRLISACVYNRIHHRQKLEAISDRFDGNIYFFLSSS